MNRFREQIPYRFCPPTYRPWLQPLLRCFSTHQILQRTHHVRSVTVEQVDHLLPLAQAGHSLLIAPNHADHADPQVLVEASNSMRTPFHFMAAREGFERSAAARFALQSMGAFSVDREGNDLSAIRMAMQVIQEGKFPLVIFPEGEIWHHHEVLDELNEGVATIAIRAAAKVEKEAGERKTYIVPTALFYEYDECVADTFSERLNLLEDRITWKPRPDLPVVERIYRLGRGMMALKEAEYLGQAREGELVERLRFLQNALVAQVEEKYAITPDSEHIPTRVKNLRQKIRGQLNNQEAPPDDPTSLYADLDQLFVAIQAYSYPGHYLKSSPSTNRIAETLLKLEEDILGEGSYPRPRDATVRFGKPMAIMDWLAAGEYTNKTGVAPLTKALGQKIQGMLDAQVGA